MNSHLRKKGASIASGSPVKLNEMLLTKNGHLKVAELQEAEKEILKRVQQISKEIIV